MNSTTSFLLCVYVAAILLQGYVAFSYLIATWAKAGQAVQVAAMMDPQYQQLDFDAVEPASGQQGE